MAVAGGMTRRRFFNLTSGLSPDSVFWSQQRHRPTVLEGESIDTYFATQGL